MGFQKGDIIAWKYSKDSSDEYHYVQDYFYFIAQDGRDVKLVLLYGEWFSIEGFRLVTTILREEE